MCNNQHRPVKATRACRGRRSLHRSGLHRILHISQSVYKYAFERSRDCHQLSKINTSVTTGTWVFQRRGRNPLRRTEDLICSSWGLIPGGIDRIETFTYFSSSCRVSVPFHNFEAPRWSREATPGSLGTSFAYLGPESCTQHSQASFPVAQTDDLFAFLFHKVVAGKPKYCKVDQLTPVLSLWIL